MSSDFMIARSDRRSNERTLQFRELLRPSGQGLRQYFEHSLFNPSTNIKPGQKIEVVLDYNSKNLELDRGNYIYFEMSTTDDTNHCTFLDDAYTIIDYVDLEINGSKDRIKVDGQIPIRLNRSTTLRYSANRISQKRAESDVDFNSLAGVEVTDAAPQAFYFNLFDIIPQFKNMVMGKVIKKLKCAIHFAAPPVSAADAVKICKSNTTSAAYTSAVSFNNVLFLRAFDIVEDVSSIALPPLDLVTIPIPSYEIQVYDNQSWTNVGTDYIRLQLNDKFNLKDVQDIGVIIEKNASAFNDASSQLHHGGFNYVKYSLQEKFGERNEISFLANTTDSTRRLRNFEIDYQYRQYGEDLPLEFFTNTTTMNRTIFSNATIIPFNVIRNDNPEQHLMVNTLDLSKQNYELEIQCAGSVGASCKVSVIIKYYDMYKFDSNGQLIKVSAGN